MDARKRWRWIASGLLSASLCGSGCLRYLNPVIPLPLELVEPCKSLPKPCKSHVHIFLMSGMDVLNCGNLTGVRDYLLALGFNQTYHGYLHHAPWFDSELRRLHKEDADARFALIGYGLGGPMLQAVAKAVESDGIAIDLLVLLDGEAKVLPGGATPGNVQRAIHLQSCWLGELGEPSAVPEGIDRSTLHGVSHFGLPSHSHTLQLLTLELGAVAAGVPFVVPSPAVIPGAEDAPTPRPVSKQPVQVPEAWDFLKPVSRLRELPGREPETPIQNPPSKI